MHHSLPHTTGISRCRSHLGPQELQLQMLRCLNGEQQEGAWPGASGEGTGGPRRPHGAHCSREMSGKAHLGTCPLRRRWSLRDASGFCPPWTAPGAAAGASSSCCSGCRGPAWSPGAPCGGVGGPRPGCCCGDKGCNRRTRQVVSPGRDVPTLVQPHCSKPWEQQLWGKCSAEDRNEGELFHLAGGRSTPQNPRESRTPLPSPGHWHRHVPFSFPQHLLEGLHIC